MNFSHFFRLSGKSSKMVCRIIIFTSMSWELYIPPERPTRDKTTGRFLQGHVPHNKGVEGWQRSLPAKARRRISRGWKNLETHRCTSRPAGAGRPRKQVIAVSDNGRFFVFKSVAEAGRKMGVRRENIGRCCRDNERCVTNKTNKVNTDHKYMGFRYYYEENPAWMNKVKG